MTAGDVIIRPATPADVPLVLELIRGLAEYERLAHEVTATEAALYEHLFGQRPYCEALIAEDGDGPAGFALFFHTYSTFLALPGLHLEDIFVYPERRGRGIGKALLVRLAQLAVARGCGRVEWTVLNWNEPSIGFYKSLGASLLDDWTICRLNDDALTSLAGA